MTAVARSAAGLLLLAGSLLVLVALAPRAADRDVAAEVNGEQIPVSAVERVEQHLVAEIREGVDGELHPREGSEAVQRWAAQQVRDASIEVDPRFGAWDASAGRVDPSAVLDDGQAGGHAGTDG